MKKIQLFFLLLWQCFPLLLWSQNVYVSTSGNDNTGDGSINNPYATISKAADEAAIMVANNPNQAVYVLIRGGLYRNAGFSTFARLDSMLYDPQNAGEPIWKSDNVLGTAVRLNNVRGSSNAWITIRPYQNEQVRIQGDGDVTFSVRNCEYLTIEGLEIIGVADSLPKLLAWKYWGAYRYLNGGNYVYGDRKIEICNVAGISPCADIPPNLFTTHNTYTGLPNINNLNVERPNLFLGKGLLVQLSHHIKIINNEVHHFPGGGLRVTQSDYVEVRKNRVHHNSNRSSVGTHGLVAEGLSAMSGDNSNVLKLIIADNIVSHNYNKLYSWVQSKTICTAAIDEGKGICLLRTSPSISNFNGIIRVENNLSYQNGKSGLHANDVDNAEFINNTVFENARTNIYDAAISGGTNAGISIQNSNSIKIINNIVTVPNGLNPDVQALSEGQNCNNWLVSNNIVFGGRASDFVGGYTIADPSFTNLATNDVSLQANSPALDAGLASFAPVNDILGVMRNNPPDIGAYEYNNQPLAVERLNFTATVVEHNRVLLKWVEDINPNANRLDIEHSLDGINWQILTQINTAAQNPNFVPQFLHFSPQKGDNFYRLKRYANNLLVKTSPIAIAQVKKSEIKTYPNPFRDEIVVEGVNNPKHIALFDILGNQIALDEANINIYSDFVRIHLPQLPFSPFYLLQIDNTFLKISPEP